MHRAYRFLLRPTKRQQAALRRMLADHRHLYNAALQERRDAYRHPSTTRIRYGDQSAQLKDIRAFDPDGQGRWSFSSQQATLRRLDKAFQAFFRRVQAGHKPGYPRFRGAGRFDTVDFPKDGDGCRWNSTPHDTVTRVRFQSVGHVWVHRHRPVTGRVKTVSVTREGGRLHGDPALRVVAVDPGLGRHPLGRVAVALRTVAGRAPHPQLPAISACGSVDVPGERCDSFAEQRIPWRRFSRLVALPRIPAGRRPLDTERSQ